MYQHVSTCSANRISVSYFLLNFSNFLQNGQYHLPLGGPRVHRQSKVDGAVVVVTHDHFPIAWLVAKAQQSFSVIFIFSWPHGGTSRSDWQ